MADFAQEKLILAFSRVNTLGGLHILNFNPKAIKASEEFEVKAEMKRLNNNLLCYLPLIATTDSHISTYSPLLLNCLI